MSAAIESLSALELLDSRGRPTVSASCTLAGGATGTASVPSGASTGAAEAHELRDLDPLRYGGLGCRRAVAGIRGEIAETLKGVRLADQRALDETLCALDGTPTKQRLGANALLAVSVAFARAAAAAEGVPLYSYAAGLIGGVSPRLPRPLINLFSGGMHGGGQVSIQDVQLLVESASTTDDALSAVHSVYAEAAALSAERYGMRLLRADEGGLAPPFNSSQEMLESAIDCIVRAGLVPGEDVTVALDVAAAQLYADGHYVFDGSALDSHGMVEQAAAWLQAFPVASLEDPLDQEDWPAWAELMKKAGDTLLLGDDLLCTQVTRIRTAQERNAANALLLKPNQVGTLTEAADALKAAREDGWAIVVSARSGDTEDDWLADLAVGWAAEHIKIGSITQSERLAKYNRLLAIEHELA